MAAKTPINTTIVATVFKGTDIETHLRIVVIDDVSYLEFRDYVPSAEEYGRGYWVPMEPAALQALIAGLTTVKKSLR